LSLSLNLEANVVLRDPAFAARLRGRLEHLIANECEQVALAPRTHAGWQWWAQLRTAVVFHFLRRFPAGRAGYRATRPSCMRTTAHMRPASGARDERRGVGDEYRRSWRAALAFMVAARKPPLHGGRLPRGSGSRRNAGAADRLGRRAEGDACLRRIDARSGRGYFGREL